MSKTQVLITGATGYLGGSVLERLVKHRTFASSEITALVRKAERVPAVQSLGVKAVVGNYDDHALLEKLASQADVLFGIADADNAESNAAILRGLKKRYQATGKAPILIHTTGTGLIMDSAKGDYESKKVYDDTNLAEVDSIPDAALHRNVDLLILAADKEGYIKGYLVSPSTIFGLATGKLVDLGAQNVRSIQIPMAVASSVARKQAGIVGKGLNVWPAVHVDDTADFYIILYDAVLAGKAGRGREGLYYLENGHYAYKDLFAKIGEALLALGVSKTSEVSEYGEEDYKNFPWLGLLGTNCKCVAKRARALGWKPKYNAPDDLLKTIRAEVELQVKNNARA